MFTNLSQRTPGERGFLVRASWLKGFLQAHELELIGATWFERFYADDQFRDRSEDDRRNRYLTEYSGVRVTENLEIAKSPPVRELRAYGSA